MPDEDLVERPAGEDQPKPADAELNEDEELEEEEEEEAPAEEEKPPLAQRIKDKVGVEVDEVAPLRKKVTVTVPAEVISEQLDEQYGDLRRDATVPGFRKGRAPRRLLEKRFGSEIGETLVQQLVSSGYTAATEKKELKVIGDPLIWVKDKETQADTLVDVQKAIEQMTLPADGPLTFSCEVEVRPEFELPEIDGIPVRKPVITVKDSDVDAQIERVRTMYGTWETLPEAAVEQDDRVLVDLDLRSDGNSIKHEDGVYLAARPQRIEGIPVEKLGEALAGAKVGETRTVQVQIPDDYPTAELRGKPAEFEFRIRQIERLRRLEADQVMRILGFDNQQELRDYLRSELEARLGEEVRMAMQGQILKYLLDNTKLDLPGRLSEQQATRVLARRLLDLYRRGVPQAEAEKHLDTLRAGAHEESVRDLKVFFIMEKLAEKIEVDIGESELNGRIAEIARRQNRRFDRVRDELAKEGGLVTLYMQIRDEKITDELLKRAKVTEVQTGQKPEGESGAPAEAPASQPAQAADATEDAT